MLINKSFRSYLKREFPKKILLGATSNCLETDVVAKNGIQANKTKNQKITFVLT